MQTSRILGLGMAVPPRIVDNAEIGRRLDLDPDWIFKRTGIETRRFVDPGVGPASLAAEATRQALAAAGLSASDLDLILFATFTPDFQAPGSSWFLQDLLGVPNVACFDIRAQCAGFLTGLSVAQQYIATGRYRHVLVVGAEVQSTLLDWSPAGKQVALLFGDGAGAAVVGPSDDPARGLLDTVMHSDGGQTSALCMKAPGSIHHPYLTTDMVERGDHFLHMDGRKVFEIAIQRFPEVIREILERNGLGVADVDLVVPHQANHRILQSVMRLLDVDEQKLYINIHRYGNTSAASIPIALYEAVQEGRVKPGDRVVLAAFGGGLAWASTLMRW